MRINTLNNYDFLSVATLNDFDLLVVLSLRQLVLYEFAVIHQKVRKVEDFILWLFINQILKAQSQKDVKFVVLQVKLDVLLGSHISKEIRKLNLLIPLNNHSNINKLIPSQIKLMDEDQYHKVSSQINWLSVTLQKIRNQINEIRKHFETSNYYILMMELFIYIAILPY